MLLVERVHEGGHSAAAALELPFDMRCKSRLRTQLVGGEEIGIFLPPGTVMRGGTLLEGSDGRIVAVIAAKEPLLEVRTDDALLLARAAYHLGNRHVAVQVAGDSLRLQPDHVLRQMLVGLGPSWSATSKPRSNPRRVHIRMVTSTTPCTGRERSTPTAERAGESPPESAAARELAASWITSLSLT
jgi:urease accessory protein